MVDYIFRVTFRHLVRNWGFIEEDVFLDIRTDILLFSHDVMFVNDLDNNYVHEFLLSEVKDLKVEFIKKNDRK